MVISNIKWNMMRWCDSDVSVSDRAQGFIGFEVFYFIDFLTTVCFLYIILCLNHFAVE